MVHGADELLSTGFAGLNVEICYGQLVSLIATVSARGGVVRRFEAQGGAVEIVEAPSRVNEG